MDLNIDLARASTDFETGIFVRVQNHEGKWVNVDIAHLDKDSLLVWLRSRVGDNALAENTVGLLLGHGHLRDVGG